MTARKLRTILSVGIMSAMALAAVAIASTARVHAAPQSIEDRVAKDQSQASPVKIYPKAVVDGQFENNKLILEPGHNGQFFVETSRRLKDGEAELHEDETDVFYVVSKTDPETKQVTNMLVKRGKELHGPDRMYVNANQIVMVEPVGPDSKVAQLISQASQ